LDATDTGNGSAGEADQLGDPVEGSRRRLERVRPGRRPRCGAVTRLSGRQAISVLSTKDSDDLVSASMPPVSA
jgi:hypothetical protein